MALINEKLKVNKGLKVIKVMGDEISVKQYLPAAEKNSILELCIQKADSGTILNTFALDVTFHTYIVIKYTDIIFSEEEKEDIFGLYDNLESNGIIDAVINAIPENEYSDLRKNLIDMVEDYKTYRNSARALVEQFTFFAPEAAEQVKNIAQNIDPDQVERIVKIADAIGMNNNPVQ